MKLSAKVACVTGSARGIGWEIVQTYAQEGAQIVICDLDQADVNAALSRLGLSRNGLWAWRQILRLRKMWLIYFGRSKKDSAGWISW